MNSDHFSLGSRLTEQPGLRAYHALIEVQEEACCTEGDCKFFSDFFLCITLGKYSVQMYLCKCKGLRHCLGWYAVRSIALVRKVIGPPEEQHMQ